MTNWFIKKLLELIGSTFSYLGFIDLAQFSGFNRLLKSIDSTEIDDIERFSDIKKGDVLAIRSLRNLKEIEKHAPLLPHLSLILRFPGDSPVVISIR
ncbi:hypothetical protein ACSBR1_012629 [Camellia fascicularis]